MTFCVNLAKESPQANGARSIQISEKKTTKNQKPKQAGQNHVPVLSEKT